MPHNTRFSNEQGRRNSGFSLVQRVMDFLSDITKKVQHVDHTTVERITVPKCRMTKCRMTKRRMLKRRISKYGPQVNASLETAAMPSNSEGGAAPTPEAPNTWFNVSRRSSTTEQIPTSQESPLAHLLQHATPLPPLVKRRMFARLQGVPQGLTLGWAQLPETHGNAFSLGIFSGSASFSQIALVDAKGRVFAGPDPNMDVHGMEPKFMFVKENELNMPAGSRFGHTHATSANLTLSTLWKESQSQPSLSNNIGVIQGNIVGSDDTGRMMWLASWLKTSNRYTLEQLRADLPESLRCNLEYRDAIAISFFATYMIPQMNGLLIGFGSGNIFRRLNREAPIGAIRRSVRDTIEASAHGMRTSGLEEHFADLMREAGALEITPGLEAVHGAEPLHVYTSSYSGNYFFTWDDSLAFSPALRSLSIEGNLNRFAAVSAWLERNARTGSMPIEDTVTRAQAAQIDYALLANPALIALKLDDSETIDISSNESWKAVLRLMSSASEETRNIYRQFPDPTDMAARSEQKSNEHIDDMAHHSSEWVYRQSLSHVLRQLRLPYRFDVEFRSNVADGNAALAFTTAGMSMMPSSMYDETLHNWVELSDSRRAAMSAQYNLRVGLMMAALSFGADQRIERVSVHIDSIGLEEAVAEQDSVIAQLMSQALSAFERIRTSEMGMGSSKADPKDGDFHGDPARAGRVSSDGDIHFEDTLHALNDNAEQDGQPSVPGDAPSQPSQNLTPSENGEDKQQEDIEQGHKDAEDGEIENNKIQNNKTENDKPEDSAKFNAEVQKSSTAEPRIIAPFADTSTDSHDKQSSDIESSDIASPDMQSAQSDKPISDSRETEHGERTTEKPSPAETDSEVLPSKEHRGNEGDSAQDFTSLDQRFEDVMKDSGIDDMSFPIDESADFGSRSVHDDVRDNSLDHDEHNTIPHINSANNTDAGSSEDNITHEDETVDKNTDEKNTDDKIEAQGSHSENAAQNAAHFAHAQAQWASTGSDDSSVGGGGSGNNVSAGESDVSPADPLSALRQNPTVRNMVTVTFTREEFIQRMKDDGLEHPIATYQLFHAVMNVNENSGFTPVNAEFNLRDNKFSPRGSQEEPELSDMVFSEDVAAILGAQQASDLAIQREDVLQRALSDFHQIAADSTMASVAKAQEAMRIVERLADPELSELSSQVARALIDGEDTPDLQFTMSQELISERYKARDLLFAGQAEQAIQMVETQLERLDAQFARVQGVPRYFNSYAERVVYNRLFATAGEHTVLIPDNLFYAHMELADVLAQLKGAKAAIPHLNAMVAYAPAYPLSHMKLAAQLAREEDWDSARAACLNALRVALDRDDAAFAYYRFAYAEWMRDEFDVAVAAYMLSNHISSGQIQTLGSELQELVARAHSQCIRIPSNMAEAQQILIADDVPVWPHTEVAQIVKDAARVTVDNAMFVPARTLSVAMARMNDGDRDGIDIVQTQFLRSLNA